MRRGVGAKVSPASSPNGCGREDTKAVESAVDAHNPMTVSCPAELTPVARADRRQLTVIGGMPGHWGWSNLLPNLLT
jgi:hypothetical protein